MKPRPILCVCAFMFASTHVWARVLPDSCGDDKVTFNVATQDAAGAATLPETGKARIVLIQTKLKKGPATFLGINDFTTRFGLDGKWLGAAGNNSYFTADIDPGEHHLCAAVQSTMSGAKDMIGMKMFTAEVGKAYYFEFTTTKISSQNSGNYYSFTFEPVDEDEGKFRVKSLKVSISTIRKTN